MTYQEARVYLEERSKYGSVLGLDTIRNLLAELDDPQEDFSIVHIAGTNGKGSLAAYLTSVLKEAGYRTGTYTSPAVTSPREVMRVDGRWISEEAYGEITCEVSRAVSRLEEKKGGVPTLFEVETAMAFLYFRRRGCRMVVLETGLGGAEDATNVITSKEVAVFTPIGADHLGVLGNSVREIARTKAGILKEGCHAVSACQSPEVEDVLKAAASSLGCPMRFVRKDHLFALQEDLRGQVFQYRSHSSVYEVSLPGRFQRENGALAIEAVEALRERGFHISEKALREGLKKARWDNACRLFWEEPVVLLDGAHNVDAARRLREVLEEYLSGKKIHCILGIFRDKDYRGIGQVLLPLVTTLRTVTLPQKDRSLTARELAEAFRDDCPQVEAMDSLSQAIRGTLKEARSQDVVLLCGSLSYLGEAARILEELLGAPPWPKEKGTSRNP